MKTIYLPFLASGKLSPDFANENLVIEGENESVEVIASFPPGNLGTVRAYLTTPKGEGELIEQGDRLSLRSDGTYRLLLTAATLPYGTLRIGFETQYGTQVTRYQTALLTVHSFVSPTAPIGKSGFTISVEVGRVTSGDVPQVTNSGTDKQAVLDFVLPRGETGNTPSLSLSDDKLICQMKNASGENVGDPTELFDFDVKVGYDQIIRTQQEFETIIASENWLGAERVLFDATDVEDNKFYSSVDIIVPQTVKVIHGKGNCFIHLNNGEAYNFRYETLPASDEYEIRNIETTPWNGFENFRNIIGCTGAIYACYNVYGCTASDMPMFNSTNLFGCQAVMYVNCHTIVGCEYTDPIPNNPGSTGIVETKDGKGIANGYAPLDANGKLPENYLYGQTLKRYGVRFGGSANTGATVTRLYDAVGLVANVGTDTATATNDFDNIYPWSKRRRCCGYFDANGKFVVTAYKGEPGYATDGSKGEVWVETPLFYYKHTYGADGSEEIVISEFPIGGFEVSPIHIAKDGTIKRKAYTAAYPIATVGGKATSRSGVFSDTHSLNSAIAAARTLGTNYTTTTTAEWYTQCLLMWVEFATRNLQNVMACAYSLPYSANEVATVAETGTNRIILATARANLFVVGQSIGIGTTSGNESIAKNRVVTAISDYDASNKALVFDGDPVNIAVGNVVWSTAFKNGSCDGVLSSSGSPVSNTDGKHNCIYRGTETPYGNAFELISDVLFKREGDGSVVPYTYDIYFLPDATKYNNGSITADYVKLTYKLPSADGYVTKLGFDNRFPFLRIPSESGGSSTTYYADNYYKPLYDVATAGIGGQVAGAGTGCGPCYWRCSAAPTSVDVFRRARLSYR